MCRLNEISITNFTLDTDNKHLDIVMIYNKRMEAIYIFSEIKRQIKYKIKTLKEFLDNAKNLASIIEIQRD